MKQIRPFTVFLLLLGIVGLCACGQAPEAKPVVVVSETATTRTIEHTFGTTEIPAAPQRVLALGEEGLLADLLDIGIQPVASIVNLPDYLPLIAPEEIANTEILLSSGDISLETLLAFNPDLIIGTPFFIEEAGYDQLTEIASTVAVGGDSPLTTYIETLTVLGLRDQGEADVAAFRELVEAEAARILADELTVSVAAIYPGPSVALFFDGPQSAPLLLGELGVTMLPVGAEREELDIKNGRAFISNERLDLLSGERLILLQSASVEGEMDAVAEMMGNPLWMQLTAVQLGNITTLDRLGYPGFRGQQALLDDLIAALE